MTNLQRIPIAYMRGGTSKAVFLHERDVPPDGNERDRFFLRLMGSPDRRQIDGLGAADVTTSKIAVIESSSRDDADVNYTFIQVGIDDATLDHNGNCGNISAAVGPFAIEEGLVAAVEPVTVVRIFNTNTQRVLVAEVPVEDGRPSVQGDYEMAGVPGTAARISLDYSATVGGTSGRLLPTGNVIDKIAGVPGAGDVQVSLVDLANPVVYVAAEQVGLTGAEVPSDFARGTEANERLEYIRAHAAVLFGLTDHWSKVAKECSMFPLLTVVSPAQDYAIYSGGAVESEDIDLTARMFCLRQMHNAYAGTGTANLGVAALIPGSLPGQASGLSTEDDTVRLGHPTGTITIKAKVELRNGEITPLRASYDRTARRLMDGWAYVPRSDLL